MWYIKVYTAKKKLFGGEKNWENMWCEKIKFEKAKKEKKFKN